MHQHEQTFVLNNLLVKIFLKSKICCRPIRIHGSGGLCRFCKRSEKKKKNLFTYFWSTRIKQLLIMMWKLLTSFILHPQVQCSSIIHITVSGETAEDEHRPTSTWYHGDSLPWSHLPNNTKRQYSMYDCYTQFHNKGSENLRFLTAVVFYSCLFSGSIMAVSHWNHIMQITWDSGYWIQNNTIRTKLLTGS